jgi:hypothetical protein
MILKSAMREELRLLFFAERTLLPSAEGATTRRGVFRQVIDLKVFSVDLRQAK